MYNVMYVVTQVMQGWTQCKVTLIRTLSVSGNTPLVDTILSILFVIHLAATLMFRKITGKLNK